MDIFERLKQRAQECEQYGFYWTKVDQLFSQISSECDEIKEALNGPRDHLQEEIGDLMDVVTELCIYLKFDPKETLIKSCDKFDARYKTLKALATQEGFENLRNQPLSKILELWEKSKSMQ